MCTFHYYYSLQDYLVQIIKVAKMILLGVIIVVLFLYYHLIRFIVVHPLKSGPSYSRGSCVLCSDRK
jgi:hypothetical protein